MPLNRSLISVGTPTTVMGVQWENEFKNKINHILQEVADRDTLDAMLMVPTNYFQGLIPRFTTDTIVTIAPGACRDTTNTALILRVNPTPTDLATTGLNGTALSSPLAGTIGTTINTTTVTGVGTDFLNDFLPGDIITPSAGLGNHIASIQSSTSLTLTVPAGMTVTNSVYRRGGRASRAWYHLYAISNGTDSGFIWSTRNAAGGAPLVDLPSGYTRWRQFAVSLRTNNGAQWMPFRIAGGWPNLPKILYTDVDDQDTRLIDDAASLNNWTVVSAARAVPPTSRLQDLYLTSGTIGTGGGASHLRYREHGSQQAAGRIISQMTPSSSLFPFIVQDLPLSSAQRFEFMTTALLPRHVAFVTGYTVTEVTV